MKQQRTISDFLNNEYLNYSLYTISDRAIPSLVDGLKPGARKIVHAAFVGSLKNGSTNKLLSLVGDTMKHSLYAHGDASLVGTICTLSKSFFNNFNPLEIEGQGGYLRSPDAGAPRYLYIRKSEFADKIYKVDYDLLDFINEEGYSVEPTHYLPIIPIVLCNTAMGIANGYAFKTIAKNPIDVIDCCLDVLNNKKTNTIIRPYLKDIKNTNWIYEDDSWYCKGEWKTNFSKDILTITDLPFDITYNDYEKMLNKYVETNYIKDYKDMSINGNINYEIHFYKGQLKKEEKRLVKKFKLQKPIPKDLLWLLDENDKLTFFETPYDVIEHFVKFRLDIFKNRKKKQLKKLNEEIKNNSLLIQFITLVCNGKLKIRNKLKSEIKVDMDKYKLPMSLLNIPITRLTKDEIDLLTQQNENMTNEMEILTNTSEKDMYINELTTLRKDLSKKFK